MFSLTVLGVLGTAGVAISGHPAQAALGHGRATLRPTVSIPAPPFYSSAWLARHPEPDLGLHAQAAVLIDLDQRQILWARDDHTERAPASLTKMMTAMVATAHAALDREVVVPVGAAAMEPDVMGLSAGETVSVRELLYGLLLDSGNDAAETLAQTLIPRHQFLAEMNATAAGWGLYQTHFNNPTGLDAPGVYSTAYDLAVIAGHLELEHPDLMAIAGTKEQLLPAGGGHKAFDSYNLNKLLWQYPGATGLKTGFTDGAGGCVVATATRGGRHLLAVVLNSDIFFTDAGQLLDYGFATRAA